MRWWIKGVASGSGIPGGSRPRRGWMNSVWGVVFAAGIGWYFHAFPAGGDFIDRSYNLLQVARGDRPVSEAVLVYMDESDHLALGQAQNRPWDRRLHARLVDRLTAAGARAIVFDVVFSDPAAGDPAADQEFAAALVRSRRVVVAADHIPLDENIKKYVPPIDEIRTNAAAIGSAEVRPGRDMIVRMHTPDDGMPSLSWVTAEFLSLPATQQPDAANSLRWLDYYGRANILPWVSYQDALEPGTIPDSTFKDRVVFVGARAITKLAGERKDEYRSPFSRWTLGVAAAQRRGVFMSGVELQATAFLNLLRGEWLTRFGPRVELFLILLVGVGAGAALVQMRPVFSAACGFGLMALVGAAAYGLLAWKRVWFPWLIVEAELAVALAWAILFSSVQMYAQKRVFENTLALYLSPKLVRKFVGNPQFLKPGADKQMLTILFSDIANFTAISEGLDSDELARLMNRYFHTAVSKCIHPTDGTVVKYLGDSIFAFWNAPEEQVDHAQRACRAALLFRDASMGEMGGRPLCTRIGLHTGVANVGNFGSEERVDYTALGENINLASRLEGLNKHLGTVVLISRATAEAARGLFVTRPLGLFRLKGFGRLVEVEELVGLSAAAESTRAWREAFAAALAEYTKGKLDAARAAFVSVLKLKPEDGPAQFYLSRIEKNLAPPDAEWSGEVEIYEK
jgi:adenylate cyclase